MEELETLSVQCKEDTVHQDLHVYASKLIVVDGSLVSVQCEPAIIVPGDDDSLSTGTSSQCQCKS